MAKRKNIADYEREWAAEDKQRAAKFVVPKAPPKGSMRPDFSRAPTTRVAPPVEAPSWGEIGTSLKNVVTTAPQGVVPMAKLAAPALLDLGKFAAKNAYLGLKDRFTGGDEQMQHFAATPFAQELRAHPGKTVAENAPVLGDVLAVKDLMGEAIKARRAGDEATAAEYEKMLLPMFAVGMVPEVGGAALTAAKRGLRGGERAATEMAVRPVVSRDIPRESVFSVTPEATPGASSGHRPDILHGSLSARKRYGEQASPIQRTPEGLPYDVMYAAQGIPQRPPEAAAGAYINSLGALETNPVDVVQPHVGAAPSPEMLARIRATENVRGLLTAQEAMAGNMPVEGGSGSYLFDMPSQPSFGQMGRTARAIGGEPAGMTATARGGLLTPFGDEPVSPALAESLRQKYPEASIVPVGNPHGFFEPALGKWGEDGIEATKPFSGEATMQTLQTLAEAPADVSSNLAASPDFRDWVRQTINRDTGAPGVREDLQNTRRLFADPRWDQAVALIRAGAPPAAALAALGYSTSSLAAPASE